MPIARTAVRTLARLASVAVVLGASAGASAAHAQWRQPSPFAAAAAPTASTATERERRTEIDVGADARAPSEGRTVLGAFVGGAAGAIVGGLVGASITGDDCEEGNPDVCIGEALPGFIWGVGVGTTVGIPGGAHLGNGRRGSLGKSFLASAAIFAAEVVAISLLVEGDTSENEDAALGVVIGAPVLQIVSSVLIERRTSQPADP